MTASRARVSWLLVLLLAGCGPSCEERGGRLVFSHFMTTGLMVGKVWVPQLTPVYACEFPEPVKQ